MCVREKTTTDIPHFTLRLVNTQKTFKRLCISFCEIFNRPEYEFVKSDWEEAINNVLATAGTKVEEAYSEESVNGAQSASDSLKALTAGNEELPAKTESMAPVDSLIISLRLEQVDNADINREEADRVESVLVKIGELMVRQIRLAWRELEPCYKEMCAYEGSIVRSVGGLHVIGFQYYETERIDNQLRGRAGRQGDPGKLDVALVDVDSILTCFVLCSATQARASSLELWTTSCL